METDRWERVVELFHGAVELGRSERDGFLRRHCGDDVELRDEVESLLRAHEADGDFLEGPASLEVSEIAADEFVGALVGERLGPYAVEEVLGRGGMGVVYGARDTRLDRRVAIKALPPELTRDERSRERLRREARAAARLSHPAIATVHSLEEHGDDLYVVYEFVEGHTLREEVEEGSLDDARLVSTALAVARALAAAHEGGVVHRDVKPDNVIRTRDGGIKVLDFGLARLQERELGIGPRGAEGSGGGGPSRLTLPGVILGTPAYMSPEALGGGDVDFRTDLFSFGVMLHELATAAHPFGGDDPVLTMARILEQPPIGLPELEGRSAGLARIVETCLQKSPADRYDDTRELVRDLERLASGAPATAEPERHAAVEAEERRVSPSELPAAGSGESPPDRGRRVGTFSPVWWWRFHQLIVGIGYYGMLVPLWFVKEWTSQPTAGAGEGAVGTGTWGSAVFYLALVPVGVAGILRIHLWFTSRYYPTELGRQRRRASPWIRTADLVFVALLLAGAWLVAGIHSLSATVLVASAVGFLIAATMIEPTTARAAFRDWE